MVEWRKRVLSAYRELRALVRLSSLRQRNHALPRPRSFGSKRWPPKRSQNRSTCDASAKQKTLYVTSSRRTVCPRGQSESPRQNSWMKTFDALSWSQQESEHPTVPSHYAASFEVCFRNEKRCRLSKPLIAASLEAIHDTLPLTVDQIRFALEPFDVELLAKLDLDAAIFNL